MEMIYFQGTENYKNVFLLSSGKRSTLKGKNLLPKGADSFLLERPLSEGV